MKNIILIAALFYPFILFSQSKIELLGSLDYSYRAFTNDGLVQSVRDFEKGKLNYHFQTNYFQKIGERFWLKLGLGFASLGYQTEVKDLMFGSQHNGQGGFDPTLSSGEDLKSKYNFHFLEIPIVAHFEFSDKKLRPFLEGGISTMYYLQSHHKNIINGSSNSESFRNDTFNQIQIASIVAFGFSYILNEKIELVCRPNFRFHLTKLANGSVKEHEWSGGLALGTRVRLK